MSAYSVYKVRYTVAIPDPDMPQPRYHTVIFVETNSDGTGWIHHVTGDLVKGMEYQTKPGRAPEESATFHDKTMIGSVLTSRYPAELAAILAAQPPPPRQKAFNTKTMKTEPIKKDGTFYAPGEDRARLCKCTEWTEEQAIPALRATGILRP